MSYKKNLVFLCLIFVLFFSCNNSNKNVKTESLFSESDFKVLILGKWQVLKRVYDDGTPIDVKKFEYEFKKPDICYYKDDKYEELIEYKWQLNGHELVIIDEEFNTQISYYIKFPSKDTMDMYFNDYKNEGCDKTRLLFERIINY